MTGAKVLIIGWDGATWDIAKPLMAQGKLPNLSKLFSDGSHAYLNSTTPPMTLPSWSSMLTGCNPGKHGIFDFLQHNDDGVPEFSNSTHRLVPTFHRMLSDRGGRVVSLAVPTTWPPEPVNGVMVSGFDSPVSTGIDGSFCYPQSIYKELLNRFGGLRFADFQESTIGAGWHSDARKLLLREIQRKEDIGCWLLEKERWDSFMLLFGESDTASHHFWMHYDESSPRHDPKATKELRETIPDVYQRLDLALGRLIESAKPNVVCICSDHGFGGAGVHAIYLNRFLEKHGWLKYHKQIQVGGLRSGLGMADRARAAAVKFIPSSLQGKVFRAIPNRVLSKIERRVRYGNIDHERSLLLSDEMNYGATIRYQKSPTPGQLEEIKGALLDWKVDGEPVVSDVFHRDSLYWGDGVRRSPELIIEPHLRENYSYTILPSQRAQKGQLWRMLSPDEYAGGKGLGMNGTHRQHGVLSLWGEGIVSGAEVSSNMMDIVPTLLHSMGEGIPKHMDGEVLHEVFSNPSTPTFVDSELSAQTILSPNKEESDAIRKRLEGLGYL